MQQQAWQLTLTLATLCPRMRPLCAEKTSTTAAAPVQQAEEGAPRHVLRHNAQVPRPGAGPQQQHHVGVLQPFHDGHFRLELLQHRSKHQGCCSAGSPLAAKWDKWFSTAVRQGTVVDGSTSTTPPVSGPDSRTPILAAAGCMQCCCCRRSHEAIVKGLSAGLCGTEQPCTHTLRTQQRLHDHSSSSRIACMPIAFVYLPAATLAAASRALRPTTPKDAPP